MSPFGAGTAAYPGDGGAAILAPRFGIYVHVPFCPYRCPYCDFNVVVGMDDLAPAYLEAVAEEARLFASRWGPMPPAGSLYVGGGTPTQADAGHLAAAIERIGAALPLAAGAEVTVETNPDSTAEAALRTLREAGVNRVSIGAQSFDEAVLRALGRGHDAAQTRAAVDAARRAGIGNVSVDLIYGTAGESIESWRQTLRSAIALSPEHVSCYALTVEAGTALAREVAAGRDPGPGDDDQADKLEIAIDELGAAGFSHYEISNWARPGFASRHNLVYWTQGDYAGLGAGAHSHVAGRRWWNRKPPRAYAAAPAGAEAGSETLDEGERAREWLQLRLRLVEGLDLEEAGRRLGRDLRPAAEPLVAAGLATVTGARFRLTRRGLMLESEAALRLGE